MSCYFVYEIRRKVRVDPQKARGLEQYFAGTGRSRKGFYGVVLNHDRGILTNIEVADRLSEDFSDSQVFAQKLSEVMLEGCIWLHFLDDNDDRRYRGYWVIPGRVDKLVPVRWERLS